MNEHVQYCGCQFCQIERLIARVKELEETVAELNKVVESKATLEKAIDDISKELAGLPSFDLIGHLYRQRGFSEKTFGPGARTNGIIDHIQKELEEVRKTPTNIYEWIDIVLLAFDGAWRAGHSPEKIARALADKQEKNEFRAWPDWRTASPDKAIEHERPKCEHSLFGNLYWLDLTIAPDGIPLRSVLRWCFECGKDMSEEVKEAQASARSLYEKLQSETKKEEA